ncbi:hypothetical protein [Persephonella sp.]
MPYQTLEELKVSRFPYYDPDSYLIFKNYVWGKSFDDIEKFLLSDCSILELYTILYFIDKNDDPFFICQLHIESSILFMLIAIRYHGYNNDFERLLNHLKLKYLDTSSSLYIFLLPVAEVESYSIDYFDIHDYEPDSKPYEFPLPTYKPYPSSSFFCRDYFYSYVLPFFYQKKQIFDFPTKYGNCYPSLIEILNKDNQYNSLHFTLRFKINRYFSVMYGYDIGRKLNKINRFIG